MRRFLGRSGGRKEGAMDGINLFFGALLGANLGTLGDLKLITYVQLVIVLVGTVMALRMVSTSEKRVLAFALLGLYLLVLLVIVAVPGFQPTGLSSNHLHRIVATLIIWTVMVMVLELVSGKLDRAEQARAVEGSESDPATLNRE